MISKIHNRYVYNRKVYTILPYKFMTQSDTILMRHTLHRSAYITLFVAGDLRLALLRDINRVIIYSFVSCNDNVSCIIDTFDIPRQNDFPIYFIAKLLCNFLHHISRPCMCPVTDSSSS